MPKETWIVGVIVARRRLGGLWADVAGGAQWEPRQILTEVPVVAAGTVLSKRHDETLVYAGSATITLHSGETGYYRDNLDSSAPSVWIALRPDEPVPEILSVSVNPYEGAGYGESSDNIVDRVPLPPDIAAWMVRFFNEHHIEHEFVKRKRDRANPDAFARRNGPGGGGGQ